jgi:predicted PurR-regulated permease PerM
MHDYNRIKPTTIASYVLVAIALFIVLFKGLLAALFSGLLVFSLVHMLAPALGKNLDSQRARMIAVAILSVFIIVLLIGAVWGTIVFFQSDIGNIQLLLQKMADIIEESRNQLPPWIREHVPESAFAIREMITSWLREHAEMAKTIGQETGRTVVHVLIGMAIGAMVALYDATTPPNYRPLAAALHGRMINLNDAFRRIVFAQVRIAGINAILTAIYLVIVLPIAGVHLPLTKTMIAITFFVGLLPVVGNLISNTVIVIVGLSNSLATAVASLGIMIVIHKLEYFLNAKIIGSHINARAWELLIAMLIMEALFGLPGVVAAPVFYAYIKKELEDLELV